MTTLPALLLGFALQAEPKPAAPAADSLERIHADADRAIEQSTRDDHWLSSEQALALVARCVALADAGRGTAAEFDPLVTGADLAGSVEDPRTDAWWERLLARLFARFPDDDRTAAIVAGMDPPERFVAKGDELRRLVLAATTNPKVKAADDYRRVNAALVLEAEGALDEKAAAALIGELDLLIAKDGKLPLPRLDEEETRDETGGGAGEGTGEKSYADFLGSAQFVLTNLRVGCVAPELDGVDLEGAALKLSDFRGKVVLLDFWAFWSHDCVEALPQRRELAARLAAEPFTLLGVAGDEPGPALEQKLAAAPLPWRSFADGNPEHGPIAKRWRIEAWPTLFLLDAKGTIRAKWSEEPEAADLAAAIDRLVQGTKSAGH